MIEIIRNIRSLSRELISVFIFLPLPLLAQDVKLSKTDKYKELFFTTFYDYQNNTSLQVSVFDKSWWWNFKYYRGDSLETPAKYYYEGWSHFDRFGVKFRFKIKKVRLPDNLNVAKCYRAGVVNNNNYRVFYDSLDNAYELMGNIGDKTNEAYQQLLQGATRVEDYLDSALYIERMRSIKNPDNSIYLSYLEKGKDQRIYYIHSQKNTGRLIVKISPKDKRMLTKHGYCAREEMYDEIEKIIESLSTTTQDNYSVIYVDGECTGGDQ